MPLSGVPRALPDASRAASARSSMPNIGYDKLGERSVHAAQESGSRTQRNTGHASPRGPRGALATPGPAARRRRPCTAVGGRAQRRRDPRRPSRIGPPPPPPAPTPPPTPPPPPPTPSPP